MKKIILSESDKNKIISEREKLILENFAKNFNKIKRDDDAEISEEEVDEGLRNYVAGGLAGLASLAGGNAQAQQAPKSLSGDVNQQVKTINHDINKTGTGDKKTADPFKVAKADNSASRPVTIPIVGIQTGVTSSKGIPSFYVFHNRLPGEQGFNPKTDRELIYNSALPDLMKTLEYQNFMKKTQEDLIKKVQQEKPMMIKGDSNGEDRNVGLNPAKPDGVTNNSDNLNLGLNPKGYQKYMKSTKFNKKASGLAESERQKVIVENFAKTFNSIKRIDEGEVNELSPELKLRAHDKAQSDFSRYGNEMGGEQNSLKADRRMNQAASFQQVHPSLSSEAENIGTYLIPGGTGQVNKDFNRNEPIVYLVFSNNDPNSDNDDYLGYAITKNQIKPLGHNNISAPDNLSRRIERLANKIQKTELPTIDEQSIQEGWKQNLAAGLAMAGGVAGGINHVNKDVQTKPESSFASDLSKFSADNAPTDDGSLNQASIDQNARYKDEYLNAHNGQEIVDIVKEPGSDKVTVVYPNNEIVRYEGGDIAKLTKSPEFQAFKAKKQQNR